MATAGRLWYGATMMTKLLEQAIAKVQELPEEEQDSLAHMLLLMTVEADASSYPLDAEAESAIREGLTQAERGEFVPDEVVAESNKRHGI
jgi:predicted transcriptional regulator